VTARRERPAVSVCRTLGGRSLGQTRNVLNRTGCRWQIMAQLGACPVRPMSEFGQEETLCGHPELAIGGACIAGLAVTTFLRSVHNSWQPDREGQSATGLALDRDVAAHYLTEAPADAAVTPGTAHSPRSAAARRQTA
jgi:hypothetical protein